MDSISLEQLIDERLIGGMEQLDAISDIDTAMAQYTYCYEAMENLQQLYHVAQTRGLDDASMTLLSGSPERFFEQFDVRQSDLTGRSDIGKQDVVMESVLSKFVQGIKAAWAWLVSVFMKVYNFIKGMFSSSKEEQFEAKTKQYTAAVATANTTTSQAAPVATPLMVKGYDPVELEARLTCLKRMMDVVTAWIASDYNTPITEVRTTLESILVSFPQVGIVFQTKVPAPVTKKGYTVSTIDNSSEVKLLMFSSNMPGSVELDSSKDHYGPIASKVIQLGAVIMEAHGNEANKFKDLQAKQKTTKTFEEMAPLFTKLQGTTAAINFLMTAIAVRTVILEYINTSMDAMIAGIAKGNKEMEEKAAAAATTTQ